MGACCTPEQSDAPSGETKVKQKNIDKIRTSSEAKTLKIVLVGNTATGKSAMIVNYLKNNFSDEYEPTVLDVYKGPKNINKKFHSIFS